MANPWQRFLVASASNVIYEHHEQTSDNPYSFHHWLYGAAPAFRGAGGQSYSFSAWSTKRNRIEIENYHGRIPHGKFPHGGTPNGGIPRGGIPKGESTISRTLYIGIYGNIQGDIQGYIGIYRCEICLGQSVVKMNTRPDAGTTVRGQPGPELLPRWTMIQASCINLHPLSISSCLMAPIERLLGSC